MPIRLALICLLFSAPVRATDWYVDQADPACGGGSGGPSDPFCRIGDALAVAAEGDTIHVAPGVYAEALQVPISLTLIGTEGAQATIVDGSRSTRVLSVPTGKVRMTGFTLRNGSIAGDGGGAWVGTPASLRLVDCVVEGNEAEEGAGLYSLGSLTLVDSIVQDNHTVWSGSPAGASGGGILAGSLTLRRTVVARNSGVEFGGGVHAFGPLRIDACLIEDNEVRGGYFGSGQGGGAYLYGGSAEITDTTWAGNRAASDGAGLAIYAAPTTIARCEFTGNLAGNYGGGIWWDPGLNNATRVVRETHFRQNSAAVGGGLYVRGSRGDRVLLDRVVIARNQARYAGGLYGDWVLFQYCTVAGNVAAFEGGGLNGDPTRLAQHLTHTIIARNQAPRSPDVDGALFSLGYNLVGDTTGTTVNGDPTGNLLDVNPRFLAPARGVYSLKESSPCVDAGDPAKQLRGLDAANHPRVLDGDLDGRMVVDMGAYEFDHVRLDTVPPAAGRGVTDPWLTLTVSGRPGMVGALWVGSQRKEHSWPPFGSLFVDLSASWSLVHLGPLPARVTRHAPPGLPAGEILMVHALGFDPVTGWGNLSNVEVVQVR